MHWYDIEGYLGLGSGFEFFTAQPLPKTQLNCFRDGHVPEVTSNGLQIDCVEALALYLCIEARKAEKSNIWKFLKVLPKDFGTLLENWDMKFHQLLPSYMAQAFEAAKEQRDLKFEKIDGFYNFHQRYEPYL